MGILLQPWSVLLFAVAMFFVFRTIGMREASQAEVPVRPLTRWIIVGISVVIVTLGVYKVQQDRHRHPFQSGTEVAPLTVR